eukprot:Filipodium_phascolosomae@DN3354_c0_g1_i1.p1
MGLAALLPVAPSRNGDLALLAAKHTCAIITLNYIKEGAELDALSSDVLEALGQWHRQKRARCRAITKEIVKFWRQKHTNGFDEMVAAFPKSQARVEIESVIESLKREEQIDGSGQRHRGMMDSCPGDISSSSSSSSSGGVLHAADCSGSGGAVLNYSSVSYVDKPAAGAGAV